MVANLEKIFKIFSELVKGRKPATPLIFVLSAVATSDFHKKWLGHKTGKQDKQGLQMEEQRVKE